MTSSRLVAHGLRVDAIEALARSGRALGRRVDSIVRTVTNAPALRIESEHRVIAEAGIIARLVKDIEQVSGLPRGSLSTLGTASGSAPAKRPASSEPDMTDPLRDVLQLVQSVEPPLLMMGPPLGTARAKTALLPTEALVDVIDAIKSDVTELQRWADHLNTVSTTLTQVHELLGSAAGSSDAEVAMLDALTDTVALAEEATEHCRASYGDWMAQSVVQELRDSDYPPAVLLQGRDAVVVQASLGSDLLLTVMSDSFRPGQAVDLAKTFLDDPVGTATMEATLLLGSGRSVTD